MTRYSQRNLRSEVGQESHEEECRCGSTLRVHGYSDPLAARCGFVEAASGYGWDCIPISDDSSRCLWTCPVCIAKTKGPCT